ncbi:hypothetical protein P353_00700 [Comamonas testosteroni]|uniref:Uncharacterized protein n=1 Tax=Comamonas testosteroni TaxID=285 RepID=A0A096HTW0_COMTE|nr:hypothetical protein P353_00700 [Comamonas testosteroni]
MGQSRRRKAAPPLIKAWHGLCMTVDVKQTKGGRA